MTLGKEIDGKAFAAKLRGRIADIVPDFTGKTGRKPGLAVVLVGEDPASSVYVRSKGRATVEVGMESLEFKRPATISQEELIELVEELEEELGFTALPDQMQPLGPNTFPAPAVVGEIHFFFHVRVDPKTRMEPGGDGSPLEEAARIVSVPLSRALAACKAGEVADAKSELALRRLAEIL